MFFLKNISANNFEKLFIIKIYFAHKYEVNYFLVTHLSIIAEENFYFAKIKSNTSWKMRSQSLLKHHNKRIRINCH